MDYSMPGFPVLHHLPELAQTHVHRVGGAIQPSHSLTYSFHSLEPVLCSMSSPNCCFLTWIQISQEAGKVVCYSHPLKNCPQFIVIHTIKGFSVVNEIEVDVFSMIQQMLAIWSLVTLPFLNPVWTSGSSRFAYWWSLARRILSVTLLVCEMSAIVWYFEHSLAWEESRSEGWGKGEF